MIQLRKYYLCDKNDTKLLELNIRICPQGIFLYRNSDARILVDDISLLPEEFQELVNDLPKAMEYFIMTRLNTPATGFIDMDAMKGLNQGAGLLQNGRLDGLLPLKTLYQTHFFDGNYYFTAARPELYCFAGRTIGWDTAVIDHPVTRKNLPNL